MLPLNIVNDLGLQMPSNILQLIFEGPYCKNCYVSFQKIRGSLLIYVTQPLYESRMNWVHDPAPPASRRPIVDFDDTPASAITSESPGAPFAPPQPKKSRRRRRRRNHRSANRNSVHRSAAPVTPDEHWANENSASQSTTRPKSAANDLPKMMSTPVYQHPSFHSSHLPQPPRSSSQWKFSIPVWPGPLWNSRGL